MRNKPKRKVILIDGIRYYSDKPGSCTRCIYFRPDFKYCKCQFSRCLYGKEESVFRKKPLKCNKFS